MSMQIIPAIDLLDGSCVRLLHGDFDKCKVYDLDAVRLAALYAREGAGWLHVVDLAASRDQGIDAFSGRYSTGAYYWHDLKDPSKEIFASTIGISNGNPVSPPAFDGAPLQGRTDLDMTQLESLLTQLQSHLSLIKGESK